jgi:hypothetical protein
MNHIQRALVAGVVALAVVTTVGQGVSHAQRSTCTGRNVVQQAPYACKVTRTIDGITFGVTVNVAAAGRAVIMFVMSPAQTTDVPIGVHSYTGVGGHPKQYVEGTIPAGRTTAQLVIPRIECGQLDIKAVETRSGASAGRIAGPYVTWGQNCQVAPATTAPSTTVPTTATAPTTAVPPEATSIVSTPTTRAASLPVTGAGSAAPWLWSLAVLALGAALVVVSHLHRSPEQG